MPRRTQYIAGALLFLAICLFWIPSNLTTLPRVLSPTISPASLPTVQNGFLETTIPGNAVAHGFTVLDNVYLREGTFFIVTKNESAFPERRFIISRPVALGRGDEPTDKVVSTIFHAFLYDRLF